MDNRFNFGPNRTLGNNTLTDFSSMGAEKPHIPHDKYNCDESYREYLYRVTSEANSRLFRRYWNIAVRRFRTDAGSSEMRKSTNDIYNGLWTLTPLVQSHQCCKQPRLLISQSLESYLQVRIQLKRLLDHNQSQRRKLLPTK